MTQKTGLESRDPSLLAPSKYDDDASSLHNDEESGSEEDEIYKQARTSGELREHDRSILLEEDEREEMLRESGRVNRSNRLAAPLKNLFGKAYAALPRNNESVNDGGNSTEKVGDGRRERRRQRRVRRMQKKNRLQTNAEHGEDGELMYEMEEGGMKEGSSTGESSETEGSSERDRSGLRSLIDERTRRRRQWQRFCLIHLCMAMGFLTLVFGAWRLSVGRKTNKTGQKLYNNGTALFAPTTILISLDGFRADFLKRGITPRLNAFIEEGVSPVYMLPSFPSVTFPNHYTLVTGLYPESHGVVGNTFWDPEMQQEFYYTDPARSLQGKWWGGEPLWVTAEMQGIRTAIHMWPGSEAHIMDVEPSFLDKFNPNEPLSSKVNRVLELLDKPGLEDDNANIAEMRPQLIAAYVPNIDTDGHKFGPNSTEIRTTINDVDKMLDELFTRLEERNLTQVVNVVVVSDHGMATTSTERLIQLDDLIDLNLIEHIDGWPLYGLRPKDLADLQGLYDKLASEADGNSAFDVYLRDVNMPERYHFSNNQRIAPLWIVPKTGWAIVTKDEFNVQEAKSKELVYHPRGLHGYDHEHPLMRAIFVARGPAFPHAPNSRVEVFRKFPYLLAKTLIDHVQKILKCTT
jgi:predicted AlkP superfamily pyrophosphatase or phosphodiesterase